MPETSFITKKLENARYAPHYISWFCPTSKAEVLIYDFKI